VRVQMRVDAEEDFLDEACDCLHGAPVADGDQGAQPSAGTTDRTLMVLGKAPIRSRSSDRSVRISTAPVTGRQLNASASRRSKSYAESDPDRCCRQRQS
jgi:hypothetical protein